MVTLGETTESHQREREREIGKGESRKMKISRMNIPNRVYRKGKGLHSVVEYNGRNYVVG